MKLSNEELKKIEAYNAERLAACLDAARNAEERAELLAHATTPGECDAEYCPWSHMRENLCCRESSHHKNCRCADCCQ